jgi:hypothetical protein
MRRPYPTDLSDAEWNYIQPHLPAPKGHGRPRTHSLREILKHPRQVSLPQTYAQPMLRAGELCVPHSKSDERAARPSYASGGTQMPTLGGSKSSYSSRLCRPRFFEGLMRCLMGDLLHDAQFHRFVRQQPQSPAISPSWRFGAGQGDQRRFGTPFQRERL